MEKAETVPCSLGRSELTERTRQWSEVASNATSRYRGNGRVVFSYPRDEQLLQELRELIAAEGKCCSFMQFNIEEKRDEVIVELRVPPDMTDTLTAMLGLVARESGSAPRRAPL